MSHVGIVSQPELTEGDSAEWLAKPHCWTRVQPTGLRSITLGTYVCMCMERICLPISQQSRTVGSYFHQSIRRVILRSGLQSLTVGYCIIQSMENVSALCGMLSIACGYDTGSHGGFCGDSEEVCPGRRFQIGGKR